MRKAHKQYCYTCKTKKELQLPEINYTQIELIY